MTAAQKVIKANFVSEEWLNSQQTFAKKILKSQQKNKEKQTNFDGKGEIEFQKNYRKEIEKW